MLATVEIEVCFRAHRLGDLDGHFEYPAGWGLAECEQVMDVFRANAKHDRFVHIRHGGGRKTALQLDFNRCARWVVFDEEKMAASVPHNGAFEEIHRRTADETCYKEIGRVVI